MHGKAHPLRPARMSPAATTLGAATVTGFDYGVLSSDVATAAEAAAHRIRGRLRNAVVETGKDLIAIKVKLEHGQFGAWLKAEFEMSDRTAQNYMNAARIVEGKSETVADLPAATLFALASPSASPELVEEVINAAEAGAAPPIKVIKEKLAQARNQQGRERMRVAELTRKGRSGRTRAEIAASLAKANKRREAAAARAGRKLAREQEERTDRLRPLAERLVAGVRDDILDLLKAFANWADRSTLEQLLSDLANGR